ncbi:hypothetical protein BD410DRAFT_786110 [Rickenella mellea]|uniref:Uncharacterized protein n=1 Tax=Rickenella mellea TaxID=50990 RepID=A0A4Y7QAB0_9AGAM|nr:hypothetical protein BD410DRAFT_786110 [Rickenella mellea]
MASNNELVSLAKTQLGVSLQAPDAVVPETYIEELRKHVKMQANNIRFTLTPQPGRGFGFVVCLEEGCASTPIPLTKLVSLPDGGRQIGIGALSAFRTHIGDHPTHMRVRNNRVRAGDVGPAKIQPSNTRDNGGSLLNTVKQPGRSVALAAGVSGSKGKAAPRISLPAIKREDTAPVIPRKRYSDTYGPVKDESDADESDREIPYGVKSKNSSTSGLSPARKRWEDMFPFTPAKQEGPSTPKKGKLEVVLSPLRDIDRNQILKNGGYATPRKQAPTRAIENGKVTEEAPHATSFAIKAYKAEKQYQENVIGNLTLPTSPLKAESTRASMVDPANIVTGQALIRAPQLLHQPVASGSNVRLSPGIGGNMDFFKDEDDDDKYDNQGNFYGRGRDTFQGPVAKPEDIDKFFLEAGNAEQFDDNASVNDALKKLGIRDLNTPLPGMEVTLMPHQAIGVAWMMTKEKNGTMGGVLGDEMGLGKTVQMIATMVFNQSDAPAVKTNLILAPVALLDQWKLEIELKTNYGLSTFIYHGSKKAKSRKELQKYDVVLTSYHTLMLEWPDEEAELKEEKMRKKRKKSGDNFIETDESEVERKKKKKKDQKPGLLMNMQWFRVVLDEAQNIRNKKTRVSRAVTKIKTTYRWCLTGTPITNGLGDAYPLLRFLEIRPWYDLESFHAHITKIDKKQPDLAAKRLQAIFATCLLRRKKDSTLDGKRLIELPPKDVELVKLDFTKDEREIYNMVETRSQQIFNRYLRAGTVLKNYYQVLVMLLRLRQICSHTSLITEEDGVISDEALNETKLETREELIHAQTSVSREFVVKMKAKLREIALQRMAAEKESADAVVENEECPICFDNFNDCVITPCSHMFCRECISNHIDAPQTIDAAQPDALKADERACPVCRSPVCKAKIFSRVAFEPTDEELTQETASNVAPFASAVKNEDSDVEMPDIAAIMKSDATDAEDRLVKSKGKGKSTRKNAAKKKRVARRILDSDEEMSEDDDDDLSDFIVQSDEDEEEKDERRKLKKRLGKAKRKAESDDDDYDVSEAEEDNAFDDVVLGPGRSARNVGGDIKVLSKLLPSTKMMHMMNTLMQWAKDHPDEKTLVISQWTQCLTLVSDYLNSKNFYHVKYQGDMNREKRDSAVRAFMTTDKVTVMLMSLKCGGVGLNLTRANRVISLDLGWSEAVESQAFDRVHRLGQVRSVLVQRLVINNTVEDRILGIQERKKTLADGSLGEGTGKKIGRLSVRELASLFGLDARGRVLQN